MNFFIKTALLGFIFSMSVYAKPSCFFTSIPKSGTHLLKELLKYIIPLKYNMPLLEYVKTDALDLDLIDSKYCLEGHLLSNKQNMLSILNAKVPGIFIYRDPRDQIISLSLWIMHKYPNINIGEIISCGIDDYKKYHGKVWGGNFNSISDMYKSCLDWKKHPLVYSVKFEDIVGYKGGGSDILQIREIKNIMKFLQVYASDEYIKSIASKIFGNNTVTGHTFRSGQIGSWKKYFTEEHKHKFKKIAGQLLIDLGYEKDLNW